MYTLGQPSTTGARLCRHVRAQQLVVSSPKAGRRHDNGFTGLEMDNRNDNCIQGPVNQMLSSTLLRSIVPSRPMPGSPTRICLRGGRLSVSMCIVDWDSIRQRHSGSWVIFSTQHSIA